MPPALPSLSVDGWITDKDYIMVKVYEHFLSSDKSQSNVYDDVGSLKYIINEFKTSSDIRTEVTRVLEIMYEKYFSSADVIVDIVETDSSIQLNVNVSVLDEFNNTYVLSRSIGVASNNILIYDQLEEEMNAK